MSVCIPGLCLVISAVWRHTLWLKHWPLKMPQCPLCRFFRKAIGCLMAGWSLQYPLSNWNILKTVGFQSKAWAVHPLATLCSDWVTGACLGMQMDGSPPSVQSFWYLEGIMGKEECRLSSSINLILFVDLFFLRTFL